MKFCNYIFVLNEVPNNSDITCVTSIVLNKARNSNDSKKCALTTMGAQQCSIAAVQPSRRKADLSVLEMRDNDTIIRNVCADGNKLCCKKEWRLYAQ